MCVGVVASEPAAELHLAIAWPSGVLWEHIVDCGKGGLVYSLHLDKVIGATAAATLLVHVEFRGG